MKIDRIDSEIDKLKKKIAEGQERLKELEKQKTDQENEAFVQLARQAALSPEALAEIIQAFQQTKPKDNEVAFENRLD